MTRRLLAFIMVTATATGCGSAGGAVERPPLTPSGRQPAPVRVDAAGAGTVVLEREDQVTSGWIAAPPADAWTELLAVYAALGFDMESLAEYQPRARRVTFSGRLARIAGERPSRYLDCGYSMSSPKADQGNLNVFLSTWLEPEDGGTRVWTRFEASARDTGTSTSAIPCSSRGALEQRIANELQLRLLRAD